MFTNPLAVKHASASYRWVILVFCALTAMFVITLPNLSLPPLFATISQDIGLSLVEIGTIWGMMSFTGILMALLGGTLGDRFGTRTTLFIACLLTALFGLTRSFAVDFNTLLLAALAFGIFQAIIPIMLFKMIHQWFPAHQLGMASGVISAGFAGGLVLGPLLSTSVILPALGGWRQVIVFYSILAAAFSLLWLLVHPIAQPSESAQRPRISLGESLRYIMGLRDVWILGLGSMGVMACIHGFAGYFPTYLKALGWADLDADRALSAFYITSLIAVVPLSILSDRLRLRRGFLIFSALVLAIGIGLLSVVDGTLILLVIAGAGFVFDTFMAILNASVLEVEGVNHLYAGTAIGFASTLRSLGGAFSPPIGNALTGIGLNVPFLFWGGMGLFAVCMFAFVLKPKKTPLAESPSVAVIP